MRISVVIPTYGRAPSLGKLLRALGEQTVRADETLLIDQNPVGWLHEQLGEDLRSARVVRCEEPNASTARNLGAANSSGELILFVDDDLCPAPSFLARARARFLAYPELGCLCPLVVSERTPREAMVQWLRGKRLRAHARADELWSVTDTISAAMFFRRDTFVASGGFDELLFAYARTGEDQELCFRMSERKLETWIDMAISIDHDEGVPGGCELRTQHYWQARERSLKSLTLRARLHNRGRLNGSSCVGLLRSAFLNSTISRHPPTWSFRNAGLLTKAIVDSRRFLREQGAIVEHVAKTDYVRRHVDARRARDVLGKKSCP